MPTSESDQGSDWHSLSPSESDCRREGAADVGTGHQRGGASEEAAGTVRRHHRAAHRDGEETQAEERNRSRANSGGQGDPVPADPPPAARKSAIVTARSPESGRFGPVPDFDAEEHQRRGDAAEALFRERSSAGSRVICWSCAPGLASRTWRRRFSFALGRFNVRG